VPCVQIEIRFYGIAGNRVEFPIEVVVARTMSKQETSLAGDSRKKKIQSYSRQFKAARFAELEKPFQNIRCSIYISLDTI